jgi:hypothetical protein
MSTANTRCGGVWLVTNLWIYSQIVRTVVPEEISPLGFMKKKQDYILVEETIFKIMHCPDNIMSSTLAVVLDKSKLYQWNKITGPRSSRLIYFADGEVNKALGLRGQTWGSISTRSTTTLSFISKHDSNFVMRIESAVHSLTFGGEGTHAVQFDQQINVFKRSTSWQEFRAIIDLHAVPLRMCDNQRATASSQWHLQ